MTGPRILPEQEPSQRLIVTLPTMGSESIVDGSQGYVNYPDCQAMADRVVITGGFSGTERTKQKECLSSRSS